MSSKFFTWTKGDRKISTELSRAGGTECVSPEGVTAKDAKRSLISFHGSPPTPSSKHSSRTTDSFALQDAAVQSATHLIAVMNSVLSSPHLSAHIDAQMTATRGRQRSHTAPPTPRVEAPGQNELAELPGSFPESESTPGDSQDDHLKVNKDDAQDDGIERPHSSPHEPSRRLPSPRRMSLDELASRKTDRRVTGTMAVDHHSAAVPDNQGHVTISKAIVARPSIVTANINQANESATCDFSATQRTSTTWAHTISAAPVELASTPMTIRHQADSEAALIQQIAYMRSSHESHIQSLKDAHAKEIDTHRTYIEFLEKRRTLSATSVPEGFRGRSSTDVSGTSSIRGSDTFSATESSTTPSSASSDITRRDSQESIAEVEALKRKLSVLRKTQIDAMELRRERDELREYAGRNDRRIIQLKDIIRKAKDNDRALRNAIGNLEVRLQAANIQRVDLLEGLEVASSDVRKLSKNEKLLMHELAQLRQQKATKIPRHHSDLIISQAGMAANSHKDKETVPAATANDEQEIERLRLILQEKNARIEELEKTYRESSTGEKGTAGNIEASLADFKLQLASAQADCERYNSLLHSEVRRQSRSAARRSLEAAPEIEARASAVAAEVIKSTKVNDAGDSVANFSEAVQLLEKELEHCTKEIIMYKLDVKGYKKDLRNAKLEINGLRALATSQRPPTPERDARRISTPRREPSTLSRLETPESGLGIRLPKTPIRTHMSAQSIATLPQTYTEPDLVSPQSTTSETTTKDKALPKLPSGNVATPISPDTSSSPLKLQRGETFRSLSESIISSYAKRSTPETNHPTTFSPPPTAWSTRNSVQNSPTNLQGRRSNIMPA